MSEVFLRVTYRVDAHQVSAFQDILLGEVVPLAADLGIELHGLWKTRVGPVGEFLELWRFDSIEDFDRRWPRLMEHPQLQDTFKVTGPMVHAETFALLESLGGVSPPDSDGVFKV